MRPTRMAICGALMIQMIAGAPVWAQGRGHGKHDASDDRRAHDGSPVQVNVVFSKGDTQVIREYYAPQHHRSLPPGLQKKYARTGKLPPGFLLTLSWRHRNAEPSRRIVSVREKGDRYA